ncbi:WD40 repeat-like protein [Neoconidiobolus thromboides FSU 785]|nr:WD40 repeat-like protein [Neoconidiobolus thromboides FSU 785]
MGITAVNELDLYSIKVQRDWYEIVTQVIENKDKLDYLNSLPNHEKQFWCNIQLEEMKFITVDVINLLTTCNNQTELIYVQIMDKHKITLTIDITNKIKPNLFIILSTIENTVLQKIHYLSQPLLQRKKIGPRGHKSMSLNSSSSKLILAAADGYLVEYSTSDLTCIQSITAHFGTIYKVLHFPSDQVILTGSDDLTSKIISLQEKDYVARSLKAHSQRVFDLNIIEKGRNIITVGKDRMVSLWNVALEKVLFDWKLKDEILSVGTIKLDGKREIEGDNDNLEEFGLLDKIVVVITIKEINFINLKDKNIIKKIHFDNKIENGQLIFYNNQYYIIKSNPDGVIELIQINLSNLELIELYKIQFNKLKSLIQSLIINNQLLLSFDDGTISQFELNSTSINNTLKLHYNSEILIDDLDPILSMKGNSLNEVYFYTRDSILSKFDLS